MPPIELPLSTAHRHAANAEEYESGGFLIPAAEEHHKAAEAFAAAVERTTDESVKRTLRMLHNEHTKAHKELQRKIDKLRADNKDPTLSQKADPASRQGAGTMSNGISNAHDSHTSSQTPLSESHIPVDESFMLLGGQHSDPGDAFNQFWTIMQGMLDNLSQPVAFATVPLGGTEISATKDLINGSGIRDGSLSSDTDLDEPLVKRMSRKIGINRYTKRSNGSNKPVVASRLSSGDSAEEDFDDFAADELSESFYMIPSGPEPPVSKLRAENATLKTEVETLKDRLAALERVLEARKEQDQQLRDSIVMARREAQRAMVTSTTGGTAASVTRPAVDFNNMLGMPGGLPAMAGINPGREAQYARRIREMEEELRTVKAELRTAQADNEKHKAIIAKFKERWDKLKESAKRKKEAKAIAAAENAPVRERIVEEPEAEQDLDEETPR